jgi:hypothetical protein
MARNRTINLDMVCSFGKKEQSNQVQALAAIANTSLYSLQMGCFTTNKERSLSELVIL